MNLSWTDVIFFIYCIKGMHNLSGWRDLNPRSSGPKPDALAPRLHPDASEHNTQNRNECQGLGAKVL